MVEYRQVIQGLNIKPQIGFFGYSSVTLIKDGTHNILVDTGNYGIREYLTKFIKQNTIHKIFISHIHFDHCANIGLFKNIPLYVHKNEFKKLREMRNNIFSDIYNSIQKQISNSNINLFSTEEYLSENTRIKFTPGHTIGHSSLEILNQSLKIIVVGDAIETYQEYITPNYRTECFNKDQYKKSFNLIKGNYDVIIPGHDTIIKKGRKKESEMPIKTF